MLKRPHCPHCDYPLNACLCHAISPIQSDTRVVVLQHPSEVAHAKNSVRLLSRVLTDCELVVGEREQDFSAVRDRLLQDRENTLVLYPADASIELAAVADSKASSVNPVNLVVIDGTWRKALKIYKLNPWLAELQAVHLGENYQGRYRIRKAKRPDSLSTLEATAYALAELEPGLEVQPLFRAFDAMVERQLAAMPEAVRQRYHD
ncbi:DTW domain-containing protein [Shewanella submarina]|uniref:tRNA-uridine aminocarboxypropyltransferase n=1 Tax=Shewanella submarina TaxID=2016376 RepID=A0ABV7GE07_9GAMM|nr:tRNA-uridine aminocarboxypropyltransferase [Shewanella submarina]MCL1038948.1 DTW domain-containing protein [Shewanella submarina]